MQLRLPSITPTSYTDQITQIRNYLFYMVEQLNWAFSALEQGGSSAEGAYVVVNGQRQSLEEYKNKTPQESFADIKGMIINSADIISAYSEKINVSLDGDFVAQSDFGTFRDETNLEISANSQSIDALFSSTQTLTENVNEIEGLIGSDGNVTTIKSSDAWVKIGPVAVEDSGHYLYGLEIGQTNEINGVEVDFKFAQYTSKGIYLYDGKSDDWSVRLADNTLTINEVVVKAGLTQGGFVTIAETDGSLLKKWIGVTE